MTLQSDLLHLSTVSAVLSLPCQSVNIPLLLTDVGSVQPFSPTLGVLLDTPGTLFVGADAHVVLIVFRENILKQGEWESHYLSPISALSYPDSVMLTEPISSSLR